MWRGRSAPEFKQSPEAAAVGEPNRSEGSKEIRARIRSSLRILGEVQVGSLDSRHILIRCELEDDCRRILMRNQAEIEDAKVWFARWSPAWSSWRESPLITKMIQIDADFYPDFGTTSDRRGTKGAFV